MRRLHTSVVVAVLTAAALAGCGEDDGPTAGEDLAGGATTVFDTSRNAYSLSARNLKGERRDRFFVGNSLFNTSWVTAPASTTGLDGLGPTFNAVSCSGCHFKDGRGRPPEADEPFESILTRLSVPGVDAHGGPVGDPVYGGQLNEMAILEVPSEGRTHITYREVPGSYGDGTPFTLLAPTVTLTPSPDLGPLAADVMTSVRVAPANFGLGLLELIPEADLIAQADPDDGNGDGISGRPNRVWSVRRNATELGRFGWKANQPDLEQQTAGALLGDLGLSSPLFPEQNCPQAQTACAAAIPGAPAGQPEVDADKLEDLVYYGRLLAVPGRRDVGDATVLEGRKLFRDIACSSCHVPSWVTGASADLPELALQRIWPYTDLLLHDMGSELGDGRPDYLASGTEWRTPPLWGIGLLENVNRHTRLLHDGRARNLTEAILWHGGEGEAARERFRKLSASQRAALLRFLESL